MDRRRTISITVWQSEQLANKVAGSLLAIVRGQYRKTAPPGPDSGTWNEKGIRTLDCRRIYRDYDTHTARFVIFPEAIEWLIDWAGGEALSFVAGWLAYKVSRGVRVYVHGRKIPVTASEKDILEILREAQGVEPEAAE